MNHEQRIQELVEKLNQASEAYYNGQEEMISNYEWDKMFDELTSLEKTTGIVLPNSPTQSVGAEDNSGEKEPHEYPALSLAKTKSIEELCKWAENKKIWLSWKLDGLTLVATYDQGVLRKLMTRGNGLVGTNITYLKDCIRGVPSKIAYKGHLVVRGEATISYPDFEDINGMLDDDDEKYANPRNLASGTLALDDVEKVKERRVHFYAFTLVYIEREMISWGQRMDYLEELGFSVVDREATNADELRIMVDKWTKKVESGEMNVPVDGLVICYDDTVYAADGPVTGHHAIKAGYAFKWKDTAADTKLKYVEWSCAASTISPVAVFEPVQLEGTTVSRASLCNLSEMKRLGIGGPGTVLSCIKSNKIIPKIIKVKEKVGELEIPDLCPACRAATEKHVSPKSNTITLHCTNPDCPAKDVQRFTRFVSKTGMDIDGLSIQTMLRFINEGYIKDFCDIYHLSEHYEAIKELEGFGEKSCDNMERSIEKSRKIHPVKFIYALCIPLIGIDAGKKIVDSIGFDAFLERLRNNEDFVDIDGIGPERSGSILKWYSERNHASLLERLLKELEIERVETRKAGGACENLTFVITGDVHRFENRNEFKKYVESNNGKVTGSVSQKTNFLINNDATSNSSKNRKAKELGIPILTEEEFIEKFGI